MKTILKIGCGVILGLGVLSIIGIVLIGQCLPPAPKPVTPTPQPLPPPREKPSGGIIKDLAYIKAGAFSYSDDAEPEPEGIDISFFWYDTKSERIYFRNIPVLVTLELFTTEYNWETHEEEIVRSVYKGKVEIDSWKSDIRIPFEDIKANPNIDRQFGVGKVTVHTPQQGDYYPELRWVMFFESD